ncbi:MULTISPECIES: DUF1302 domain-containing protein [Corallincola]|uniref:DUF1302 domain-containing protein n=3 Tax=Corallincola TaxID=1775176 RepID=A0A368NRC9_9GAMM|nr:MULTISPECIES: DUF1302 domain-containing protein [Corallincola]RCU52660.1 DUF1302 domain-containing protein [Corallincola holothuriorum]TAA48159.1 DUF1302 domain-containing protein [Corallincola spongiicola]TCI03158.1 DUF1302 domain-containing protein [Corallincola luteus]
MTTGQSRFIRRPIAKGISIALLALSGHQAANAVTFDWGEIEGSFDSTFTVGASWRVEDRDYDLIGKSNQPEFNNSTNNWQGYDPVTNPIFDPATVWANPTGIYSTNSDNANLTYDAGDSFSQIVKGVHELELNYQNFGLFVRGMYFYDFAMMDTDEWDNPVTGESYDPCRDGEAKDEVCRDIRLLDAYITADFDLGENGDMPLSLRLGDQVVNWGESTFIPHGLSEIVPVDIAQLRTPGAELREAFIPVGMLFASLGLTENVTLEAFYQYDWEKSVLPPPGSYFSTNDFAGSGGHLNTVQLQFAQNPDQDLDGLVSRLNGLDGQYQALTGMSLQQLMDNWDVLPSEVQDQVAGLYIASGTEQALKIGTETPDDGGQYGIKLGWFVPELNDTEFGFYYVNYHSRRPIISGYASNFCVDPNSGVCAGDSSVVDDLNMIAANTIDNDNVSELTAFTRGVLVYPEDINMFGLSFNTGIGDTSVAGEVSHRQDEPLQIDDVELLFAFMPEQLANADPDTYGALAGISQLDAPAPGGWVDGYVESDTTQMQFTLTHLFGPTWGADNFFALVEFGGIYIHDMPDHDDLRLNAPGTDRSGGFPEKQGLELAVQDGVETNPFPDDFSWGYRLRTQFVFNDVFSGVNMSPRLFFAHDVSGTTPDPLFMFIEERKSAGLGVGFDYLQRWSADFSYNTFWDGKGTSNRMEDRDFVSFNIKYSI